MAKDHEKYSHAQELARAYEQKLKERDAVIQKKITAAAKHGNIYTNGYLPILSYALLTGLSSKKYEKPTKYFKSEHAWIFGSLVYDRFKDAFLYMADQVREYPYSVSWNRRSFRSENYSAYADRVGNMLTSFWRDGFIDADICDILTGNLPEEVVCYLRSKEGRPSGFAPEVLAYELDQNNLKLEKIVTDIINGEVGFSAVSRNLIRGIILSRNERMHQLLCKLLLAARLQEGLRQAICEDADWGTKEAFMMILSTIAQNDLIRYSSVKRAVGTWLGLISEETRDLDRVSGKSVELICKCISDSRFREECLNSEDAMQIYIALWSGAFDSVEHATKKLDRISREGTHHQILTAGYFVNNLDDPVLRQTAARTVLSRHRDSYDILAVYLPHFIPYPNGLAHKLIHKQPAPTVKYYFDTNDEAKEFCDWLISVHASMKKKELVFEPCIFPWNKAVLKKSDLIEKAMIIAAAMMDQERIDRLCPLIGECEAFGRDLYFKVLTMYKKTPAVREAIIKGLADKSADTRRAAFESCKGIKLTQDEYLAIEDMLRLRYEDLRRNAMELLLKQSDELLEKTIERLLSASKTEKRTAALDMLTQLNKNDDRRGIVQRCLGLVNGISKPTTQEQILIDVLAPKKASTGKAPLFTEADRYKPVIELDDYSKACIREFGEFFPESNLEKQVLEGTCVLPKANLIKPRPCRSAAVAKERLKELSDFFTQHETEHFDTGTGYGVTTPISIHDMHFVTRDPETGSIIVPRMDLWNQWYQDRKVTVRELMSMLVLLNAQNADFSYLKQCGSYIADIFGSGFETPVKYRYMGHMNRIVQALLCQELSEEARVRFASVLGMWIARCLPDQMLIGDKGVPVAPVKQSDPGPFAIHYADPQMRTNMGLHAQLAGNPVGHFIAHPQITYFLFWLKPLSGALLKHIIPITVNVYERTFESTRAYFRTKLKQTVHDRQTLILGQIYSSVDMRFQHYSLPDVATYLYAFHYGLISERTLYYHLMEPAFLKNALELVTAVCVMKPTEGRLISSRCFAGYRGRILRTRYESFIGKDKELSQDQLQLIELCRTVADKLISIVVGAELLRGDSPTEYSKYVAGIQSLSGAEIFVRILSALGKDALDRSVYYWGNSDSRRGNLSHLLARCAPAAEDSAETLRALLKGTDISEKRLIEAALYSPEWIDIIGQYLELPGFKSVCYYFMAHMNERFDEQKKAIIARYSPLSEDELNLGAFDVHWFRGAFEQVGEKKFELIYDAAKYISDGNKHTRARKFADAALGRLDIEETETAIRDKRNKDLLMAYAIIPLTAEEDLIHRYLYLQQFLKESRQFGSQRAASEKKAAEAALRNLATNAGFSDTMRLTLRMETRLVEDHRQLFSDKQVGEWVFRLAVDDQGEAKVECFKDGKQLKSIPSKVKKDAYVIRLLDMKKLLTEQYRRTRRMFEQAMEDGTRFSLEELRQLTQNRVVAPIVSRLIFKSEEHLGLFDGRNMTDLTGNILLEAPDAQLTVAHPLHLFKSGQWIAFQRYIFDGKIVQPFKQVFRELYVKTKDELGLLHSLRYAGNQIQPRKAAACLKDRRWVADVEAGLQKVYYQENIVATIFAMADWFSPADIEAPTLEYVAFFHRKTGAQLKIDDIPDVIFSEVMRDVDMAVSVAHAGGVDPETSHSTVEMRAAILGFTLPLLGLNNVEVSGSHAIIQGKLAQYSVHLGSGIVHQIGGTMLNVLPVHSQHRGRIFLPFVDEDPKTAEIISKVILFSEDRKLKDPSILSQISY